MKGTMELPWLGQLACERPENVGNKAAVLSRLLRRGYNVPLGFCLTKSFIEKIEGKVVSLERCSELERAFRELVIKSMSGMLIVRSSAIVEDVPGHLFPGRFVSVADVTCIEELVTAIKTCMASVESNGVRNYCASHGLDPREISMCVLVQEQVEPEYAGVCSTDLKKGSQTADITTLVEFTEGRSAELLAGEFPSFVVRCKNVGGDIRIEWLQGSTSASDFSSRELRKLARISRELWMECRSPYILEWAFKNERLYILQVRSLEGQKSRSATRVEQRTKSEGVTKEVFAEEAVIGLKGAAMKLFCEKGWFSKPAMFIEPQSELKEFIWKLNRVDWGDGCLTVRFSHKNEIGLPRAFVKDSREAAHFLQEVWRPEWFGIVHVYIKVKASFELYVAGEHAVLEHMPGIWESNNQEPPDVVIMRGEIVQVMAVCKSRVANYVSHVGTSEISVSPTQRQSFEKWSVKMRGYVDAIRAIFDGNLPLICHFVEDERGAWQFLNIRRTGEITNAVARAAQFHIIREVSDFESWNRKDPLLLQITVERGREKDISQVAEMIPSGQTVYVDSGILSHPAIVLRELGIRVTPVYMTHKKYEF